MQRLALPILILTLVCACAVAGETQPMPEPKSLATLEFKVVGERIFVPATINGQAACQALLDTGSELTLLNRAKVTVKGLRLNAGGELLGDFVGTLAADSAVLESLALGPASFKNVRIGVINHGQGQKLEQIELLLGMDVLSRCRFTLDFARERLIVWGLGRGELPPAGKDVERIRLALQPGRFTDDPRPRVLGTINGKAKATFLIDTAADLSMFVATKNLKDYDLESDGLSGLMGVLDGSARKQLPLHLVTFSKLALGNATFEQVKGRALDCAEVKTAHAQADLTSSYNVLGISFLKTLSAFHYVPVDGVYLERAKPPSQ